MAQASRKARRLRRLKRERTVNGNRARGLFLQLFEMQVRLAAALGVGSVVVTKDDLKAAAHAISQGRGRFQAADLGNDQVRLAYEEIPETITTKTPQVVMRKLTEEEIAAEEKLETVEERPTV